MYLGGIVCPTSDFKVLKAVLYGVTFLCQKHCLLCHKRTKTYHSDLPLPKKMGHGRKRKPNEL